MGRLADDREAIHVAERAADSYVSDPEGVDPDVGQAGLFVTAGQSSPEWFERISAAHEAAETPQREMRFLQALTEFDTQPAIDEMFKRILDGRIRNQDSAWVLMRMLSNRKHGLYVWESIESHWQTLMDTVPALTLRHILDGIPALSHPDVAGRVEAFLTNNPIASAAKTQAQNIEKLHSATAMRQREAPVLRALFA
jgi:hypothetical protein